MKKIPVILSFFLALFVALFGTVFFPNIRLIAFAPFLALIFSRSPFLRSLWMAFLCGAIMDLLNSQMRFGLYTLNYCLTALLIYSQKRHFFADKPLALSLYTALFSFVSTGLHLLLLSAFDQSLQFSGKFALTDLICMPLLDAVYAFIWFTCPIKLYQYIQRLRAPFLNKEEEQE